MKLLVKSVITVLAIFFCNFNVKAETTDIMEGEIGKYKITMELDFKDNGTVNGWYYYKSKGPSHKISLSGTYKNARRNSGYDYDVNLTESVNGKITGYFKGEYLEGYAGEIQTYIYQMEGTWTSPNGKKLKFSIGN